MKISKIVIIFTFLFVCHSAISRDVKQLENSLSDLDEVMVDDLKREMDEKSGVMVVNVLNPTSFKDCHIKGSVNIPMDKLKTRLKRVSKDKKIVVHCASYECPLSKAAYKKLKGIGFNNVRSYEGGMREWKKREYPVIGKCKAGYLKG